MILTTLGIVVAFDIPARQAFLMDMVGREDLFNAIALNSSMFNAARITLIRRCWCAGRMDRRRLVFFVNGISYEQ
jgi:hypothetical protein